ncbi:MAG: tetratricopeptide repeat protein [Puniceicoccaceae bacterium]|nr:tetratricopeptide repeat protein [Puniceicoccaceae bacterium]
MRVRTLVTSLLLCLSCLDGAPQTERIEFYFGIAEGNYLVGDLGGAERGIEQILRIDPDYIPALTLKARVMLDNKRPEAALEATERALALAPDILEYHLLKARILGQMERHDEASACIQKVIAQAPPESDDARAAHQLLGLLLMAEREWDQAAQVFKEIYQVDPTSERTSLRLSSEAYLEKARAALTEGEPDKALAAIDQAIAVYSQQTGQKSLQQRTALRLMRARLLAQLGRLEAAIQDLQILTGQQPENFDALITLASLYASVERWDSLEALIKPIAKRPELQDVALYLEGRAALAKNRVGTARAKFEAAIGALPKEAKLLRRSLFFYRGICLQQLGRQDEADTEILRAIDAGFRPETREEALIASRTLLRAERAAEAIPILEAITLNRIDPGADIWAMLGRAHLTSDTPALALSAFNEALRIAPEQSENRALRASLLRKIGDLEGALADYKAALRLSPDNPSIRYALGLVYLQLGRIAEAEVTMSEAAKQLKDQAGLQLLHALLAYTVGEKSSAKTSLHAYQDLITEAQNPTALYLEYLLEPQSPTQLNRDEVSLYFLGKYTRKEALDAAGQATTPEQAKQQICAAAFWMAQYEAAHARTKESRELLSIAIEVGKPDYSEYQLARWQIAADE